MSTPGLWALAICGCALVFGGSALFLRVVWTWAGGSTVILPNLAVWRTHPRTLDLLAFTGGAAATFVALALLGRVIA